ncbi:MAG TPA: DUF4178 domain-containing protein [Candidatus Eremiobacteraeota bacterium]|nr:MAG: hypothetical protein BWY64_00126 [bacterium ADurb.Bin363]HPZ06573.1 DUF4178 domain-containing protein [Candidatus Eremiobacteraeota bacterium]
MEMQVREMDCPSCGGSLKLTSVYVRTTICPYCDQTLHIDDFGLSVAGKQPKLADYPTRFALGRKGKIKGKNFEVVGRVRYRGEDCFWDEWYLTFEDGKPGWLTEEEGECALFNKEKVKSAVPDKSNLRVGKTIDLNNYKIFITEIGEVSLEGGEGQLFFVVRPNTPLLHIDGNAGGKLVSIEFYEKEIEFHIGESLEYEDILISKEA